MCYVGLLALSIIPSKIIFGTPCRSGNTILPNIFRHAAYWEHVPEMVPELVVPDLEDCDLKPYVSYATEDVYQEELTSKDLFNVIYGRKIIEDFKQNNSCH